MHKLIVLIAASFLFTACATTRPTQCKSALACAKTPHDVDAYLKNQLPKKTLKKWDAAISDDILLVDVLNNRND